jgi:hypothetical protein
MAWQTDVITMVSLGTYGASGTSHGFAIGCFEAGALLVYVQALTAPSRLTPRFEVSPNGNLGTGGHYTALRVFATALKATGLSVLTLPHLAMPWARVGFKLSGTAHQVKFPVWGSFQGRY